MRWWIVLFLLPCACDKLSGSGGADGRSADSGMREDMRRFTTTQGAVATVGDEQLVQNYPLPRMPDSQSGFMPAA